MTALIRWSVDAHCAPGAGGAGGRAIETGFAEAQLGARPGDVHGAGSAGCTMAGIAPWLELGPDETPEGKLRGEFIELSVKAIGNGTDPKSPDFLNFKQGGQPLVDAAFLAQGLLRAPKQVWERLTPAQQTNVVAALKATRGIKPLESNWLLFSAMVEAALWQFTGECELRPIEYAVQRHMEWYLGDGTYGDGPEFHWDYYNSFVIQPMLLDVLRVAVERSIRWASNI